MTIIKLLDGTKAYVHPMNTHAVLTRAASHLDAATKADVFMDSGVENLNADVDALFDGNVLQRVIAQIDVSFLELADRGVVAIAQASMAVPAPARQHRHGEEARRILRDRAQRDDSAQRVRGPDAR